MVKSAPKWIVPGPLPFCRAYHRTPRNKFLDPYRVNCALGQKNIFFSFYFLWPYRNEKNSQKICLRFFESRNTIKIITKAFGLVEGYFLAKKRFFADSGPTQVQNHDEKMFVKRLLCPTLGKILGTCLHWCVIGAQGRKSWKMTRR